MLWSFIAKDSAAIFKFSLIFMAFFRAVKNFLLFFFSKIILYIQPKWFYIIMAGTVSNTYMWKFKSLPCFPHSFVVSVFTFTLVVVQLSSQHQPLSFTIPISSKVV